MTVFILTHTVVCEISDELFGVYATRELAQAACDKYTKVNGLKPMTEEQKSRCKWSGEWFDVREEWVMGS